jgi:hypothetical protein
MAKKLDLTPEEESLWRLMVGFFKSAKETVGWNIKLSRFQEIASNAAAHIQEETGNASGTPL